MSVIRKLTPNDVTTIVMLEEKIFGESLGEEMLLNELNNPLVWFYVIEEDNKVIGYIGGYFYLEDGEILNFLIDENYQHQGYGTKLFNFMMQKASNEGIKKVTLEVRVSNTSGRSFYVKQKFKEIFVRKNYYKNGEDAIVMLKELI